MWERLAVVVSAFGGVLLFNGITIKHEIRARERWIMITALVIALYLGIDFIVNEGWINNIDLVEMIFGDLAQSMDELLRVK